MEQRTINPPEVKPRTKTNWWPMWLGLGAVIIGPVLGIINLSNQNGSQPSGENSVASAPNLGIFSFLLSIIALVVGIMALKKGQRSVAVWSGFGLAVVAFSYFAYIGISEIISAG
jgi:hypothetical protein